MSKDNNSLVSDQYSEDSNEEISNVETETIVDNDNEESE